MEVKSTVEVKTRMAPCNQTFQKNKNVSTYKYINIEAGKPFVKPFIFNVILYGCESWIYCK